MAERFVLSNGTISVAMGGSTVTGTSTTFAGRDLAGALVYAVQPSGTSPPTASPPQFVGVIAEVIPRGIYDNLSLPLAVPYYGAALVNVAYVLIYGPAIANGATQAAVLSNFISWLQNDMGLSANYADLVGGNPEAFVPNNTAFFDPPTKTVWLWTDGVLTPALAGFPFDDMGTLAARAAHNTEAGGYVYYATDTGEFYTKNSATSGDWGAAVSLSSLGAGQAQGVTVVDFGSFPGDSNVQTDITGLSAITAGADVEAWIIVADSADHTADEHVAEPPIVAAGNVIAGTGFSIYAMAPPTAGDGCAFDGQWNVGWRFKNN